jgi:hypothetical protein
MRTLYRIYNADVLLLFLANHTNSSHSLFIVVCPHFFLSLVSKDGNGVITAEELQNIFTLIGERDVEGQFLSLDQVQSIIRRFDDNNDGSLQYEEFAQLWMAKRRSAMSQESLRRAVVVCGYNEVGQQLCALLDKANIAGIPYVAFARKTEQISASVS